MSVPMLHSVLLAFVPPHCGVCCRTGRAIHPPQSRASRQGLLPKQNQSNQIRHSPNGKSGISSQAVDWEEISAEGDTPPKKVEACLPVFRPSVMDYRRHVPSEVELQRECERIRNTAVLEGVGTTSRLIRGYWPSHVRAPFHPTCCT